MNVQTLLLRVRTEDYIKRIMLLLMNHTPLQMWNMARMKISQLKPFRITYLPYEPIHLAIMVTFRCNLRCPWCPYISSEAQASTMCPEDMQMETFEQIMRRFRRTLWLELTGGEPFIHDRIFEMIDYAHQRRLKIYIPTNGLLIHHIVDKIARSPLRLLNISLNACDSDEFFQLHGVSQYNYQTLLRDVRKIVEVRNLYNKGLRIRLSYVCHKANYENIPKMVKLAEDLRVDQISFHNLIPHGITGFLSNQCLYQDDREVIEVIEGTPSPGSDLQVVMPRLYGRGYLHRGCNLPFTTLHCSPRGDISPCCQVPPQAGYGNILADEDIWNSPTFRNIREVLINTSLPLPGPCKTCPSLVAGWRPSYVPPRRGIR